MSDKIMEKQPGKGLVAYVTDDYRKEVAAKGKRAVKVSDHRGYGKSYADGVQNLLANWEYAPLPEAVRDMNVEYTGSEATVYGLTTDEAVMLAEWINKLGEAVYESPRELEDTLLDALDKMEQTIVDMLAGGALVPPLPEAPADAPKCNCPDCRKEFGEGEDEGPTMDELMGFGPTKGDSAPIPASLFAMLAALLPPDPAADAALAAAVDASLRGVATPGCDCPRCAKLRAEGKV